MDKDTVAQLEQDPILSEILQKINEMISANTKRFKSDWLSQGEKIDSELFPPCIRAILYRAVHGENLGHYERLSLAFFYLNTNHTIEETVDLFRTCPDFDEKISRYQVEFAAGSGGKGKKYTMFSCAKLKTLNICKATDSQFGEELCALGAVKRDGTRVPIRHPNGDYVFWKKVELNRINRAQADTMEQILDQDTQPKEE
jgi:DNA primase large subunit